MEVHPRCLPSLCENVGLNPSHKSPIDNTSSGPMSLPLRGCICSNGAVVSLSVVSSGSLLCHIPCDSFYNAMIMLDSHNSPFVIARNQSSKDRAIAEGEAMSRAGSDKALDPGGLDQPRNHLTKMNICV